MAILIPTYLEMCSCGRHGRFVTPGEVPGTDFASLDHAKLKLERLRMDGKIDENEEKFLWSKVCEEKKIAGIRGEVSLEALLKCEVMQGIFPVDEIIVELERKDGEDDEDTDPPPEIIH